MVAGITSQSTFELTNFNITKALLKNSVDVSALPDLAPLTKRGLTSSCSAACSSLCLIFSKGNLES
ncbi:hypothetical protein M3J09_005066 [Ascochyta lentis]